MRRVHALTWLDVRHVVCFPRPRFNDFYTRYSSLLSSNRTNTASSTTTGTTAGTAITRPASEQQYVPLSRRRQLEREQRERERMLGLSSIVTTTRFVDEKRAMVSLRERRVCQSVSDLPNFDTFPNFTFFADPVAWTRTVFSERWALVNFFEDFLFITETN